MGSRPRTWVISLVLALACVTADASGAEASRRLRVLILSGRNNHDWQKTTPALKGILDGSGRFVADVVDDPATCDAATFAKYAAVISNWTNWPDTKQRVWGPETEKAFLEFVRNGGGFALFHAANTPFQTWPEFQQMVGTTWELGKTGHGVIHTFKVTMADRDHPITRGVPDFWIRDELWHRTKTQPGIHVLCEAFSSERTKGSGRIEPVALCTRFGEGRCFNLVLGHDVAAMRNVGWRALMCRGTEWAATGAATIAVPSAWPEGASAAEPTGTDVEADLKAIGQYALGQSRAALARVERRVHRAATQPGVRPALAAKLAGMLDPDADVTLDCREFVCRQIGLIGSAAEVPALARLLGSKDLSFPARAALESILGEAATAAVREAMGRSEGAVLIGLINTLGNRRDAGAVDALARRLGDADPTVAAAAVDALGKIGGESACKALRGIAGALPADLRHRRDDALLKCAAGLVASGKAAQARAIYTELSATDKPAYVRSAGFVGRAASAGDELEGLLLAALLGEDEVLRSGAIGMIRAPTGVGERDRLTHVVEKALTEAGTPQQRSTLLGLLGTIHSDKTLRLAVGYLSHSGMTDSAADAVVQIAAAIRRTHKKEAGAALHRVLAATIAPGLRERALVVLLKLEGPPNLAPRATASSPDGLDKDGAAGGDQAGIDGKPATYWDEKDDQALYRFKVTFPESTDVSAISVLGYRHRDYAPRDFEILCDGECVKRVSNARYSDNELVVVFPRTECTSLELKITGYYGKSPAIRELGIYDLGAACSSAPAGR